MSGLFAGTSLERPVTCEVCRRPLAECDCPRGADGTVRRPQDQRIVVRSEKRPGGRRVTVARGFDPVASDLKELARTLRERLATGGTVDGEAIEVRGEHVEPVAAFLTERGYRVRTG
ncbi:MAG: SUI1 family translation initiation factor [Planctomycetota bacterium]|jgi:translation initiation factor 1